ncbi:hypothetical protein Syn7502_03637 (plasmid) [Synechococcus sp. PCC 7502]|uniref:hypothetical protein n=1 Tax=Synechococcus sp. PCC 7502 TaxID=1173263 RepID=UPI00029F99D7|nr:hypothetical protein [Synechococcus sp. PCC 7502]AFY75462.1 hypothetical protein Syn7502_03637 [Synechococcus sp. PCC 7502]
MQEGLPALSILRVAHDLYHASRDMRSPAWHYCIAYSSDNQVAIAKKSDHIIIGWATSQDEAVKWIEAREKQITESEQP